MNYNSLTPVWQRVFALAWESLIHGSKAIGAVIATDGGTILSEGRNRLAESYYPNPLVAHAEQEAVIKLDLEKYPDVHQYRLYAGLEPCIMCMGTIVMGHIRHIEIAARDAHGGAAELLEQNAFLRSKKIEVTYTEPWLGSVQRCLQAVREYRCNRDERSRAKTLEAISLCNPESVTAAKRLVESGFIEEAIQSGIPFAEVFDRIAQEVQ